MHPNLKFIFGLKLLFSVFFTQATNWHVSNDLGSDNLIGDNGKSPGAPLKSIVYAIKDAWEPGDTIFVMNGTYRNSDFGNGTNAENPAVGIWQSYGLATSKDAWLVVTNYPGHHPKIQFNGQGGIIVSKVNYIDISGIEIEGPNQSISRAEATANRLIQDTYYSGRGVAIWTGHHIKIHNMKIHDCPNSGIRSNNGDYIDLSYNEVYNCTWWSSNAESAIVVAQAKDFDDKDTIKIRLTHNVVHHNRNYIPYYNSSYPPNSDCYGNECQTYIIDGSGVYITRNKPGSEGQTATDYSKGWFYFANNITYENGINGLVVHKSDRAIVTNNLAFMNGAVPKSEGRQNAGGIVIHTSEDVYMYNNISWVNLEEDFTYQVYGASSYTASNNIGVDGNSAFDPSEFAAYNSADGLALFVDTAARDFHLVKNSIAQDLAYTHSDLPELDFDGLPRSGTPDIGPFEYQITVGSDDFEFNETKVRIFPNPVNSQLNISSELKGIGEFQIFDTKGKLIAHGEESLSSFSVDVSKLSQGTYFLMIQAEVTPFIVK